jgi:ABC-type Fe3+/spermidine/putrescine transport system ATPase subunit
MANMIQIKNLSNFILNNINLSVKKGELFVLLGPNGAGKTTILNAIAGICNYTGTITIDGKPMEGVPMETRDIGYVFQGLLLFPHLTVYENIAFGLKMRKKPYAKKVEELLHLFNLQKLSKRYPTHLSGGEKQKVALARALAIEPKIILMDEPFNKLDPTTASYMRDELKQIQENTSITTLFVTHNQFEAKLLANRIAVFHNGNIEQIGTPTEIFHYPKTKFIADFIRATNILNGYVRKINSDKFEFNIENSNLSITVKNQPFIEGGKNIQLSLPPENITLSLTPEKDNHFLGFIENIKFLNNKAEVEVNMEGFKLKAFAPIEYISFLTGRNSVWVCFSKETPYYIQ